MTFFKQKIVGLSPIAVLVVLVVFGAAMMGSVLGTKPQNLPVALVVLDQPAQLPSGGALAVGEMMKQKLTSATQLPISWKLVGSEEEARQGLDERDYYGALIVPADLSAGVASLAGPAPRPATVRIIANEGMNTQAATIVKQGLGQAMKLVSGELSATLLEQLGQQGNAIPVAAAKSLLSPIVVQEETVHGAGANNASGNAPGLMTQIMWLGSLVTAVTLFLASQSARKAGARAWASIVPQPVAGMVIVGAASAFLVWMASGWYGMELSQGVDTWLFLWLAGVSFFLLQSALLNWLGFPAMAILVLLMFFSMPLLNMAPEFLSQATHDWIYSWTPLRFAAGGMREVMYYGGLDAVGSNAVVLWAIAGGFLLLQLAAAWKNGRARQTVSDARAQG